MKPISSKEVSKLFHLPYSEEFLDSNFDLDRSIYVGKTKQFGLPFFLDFDSVFNPHIFVFGMSGSGKSYMLKAIVARLEAVLFASIFVIDFTGEYSEFCSMLNFRTVRNLEIRTKSIPFFQNLNYLDLRGSDDAEKEKIAALALQELLLQMRRRGPSKELLFVVLDEAWKLLLKGDLIDILIREGRKYGVGMILASQILGDIKEAFLSNVATIFCFRVQDNSSLLRLEKSYFLSPIQVESIKNLEMGNCLAIRLHKGQKIESFFLDKVPSVLLSRSILIIVRDSMRFEIPSEKFDKFLSALQLNADQKLLVKQLFEGNYSVELSDLIYLLMNSGAKKVMVLLELRRLKIDDDSIADAFAIALSKG